MKKFRLAVTVLISFLLLAIAGTVYYVMLGQWHSASFAAGNSNTVRVYKMHDAEADAAQEGEAADQAAEASGTLEEAGRVIRGSRVEKYRKSITVDGIKYYKVSADLIGSEAQAQQPAEADASVEEQAEGAGAEIEDIKSSVFPDDSNDLYMSEDSLASTIDDTVLETAVYVRTPTTIYADKEGPAIASFAPKGTVLPVAGHDALLENGFIHKYKVAYTTLDGQLAEGYVYGKYMAGTQEEADANYNEHGEYKKAKKDKFRFNLYGGEAKNLDYYPYEKTPIEGNEFCSYARTMYLNGEAAVHSDKYIKIINKTDCNAVVMDLKDGYLAFQSDVAKELSPTSYKSAYATVEDYKKSVDALRETGVYLIGRIVVFNDPQYAKDHPEDCIKYAGSTSWPSGFSRGVWEYNVRLAQEAVEKFGFNEIQFDYVRFPEATYDMSKSGNADFRNKYGEEKAQAIQNFCFYAADQLREAGAYISVDVFGESAYSYVTAYGQYWTAISNIVDAISAMPYTDHFQGDEPWAHPYDSVLRWAKRAAKQQKRLQNPAAARTWITGYNTPYWAPSVTYDSEKMEDQIRALEEAGLNGGFIPWNALSDINKYKQYKSIWNE